MGVSIKKYIYTDRYNGPVVSAFVGRFVINWYAGHTSVTEILWPTFSVGLRIFTKSATSVYGLFGIAGRIH